MTFKLLVEEIDYLQDIISDVGFCPQLISEVLIRLSEIKVYLSDPSNLIDDYKKRK